MTVQVDMVEAQRRLLELVEAAARGEAIVITRDAVPVAQLVAPLSAEARPTFGSARGLITIADDFDAPLDEFREYVP